MPAKFVKTHANANKNSCLPSSLTKRSLTVSRTSLSSERRHHHALHKNAPKVLVPARTHPTYAQGSHFASNQPAMDVRLRSPTPTSGASVGHCGRRNKAGIWLLLAADLQHSISTTSRLHTWLGRSPIRSQQRFSGVSRPGRVSKCLGVSSEGVWRILRWARLRRRKRSCLQRGNS